MNDIGRKIAKLRESMDYTQQDLAGVFGVSRSAVNAWEMGKAVPGTKLMPEIAKFFHVSTDYLYGIDSANALELSDLAPGDVEALTVMANLLRKKSRDAQ